MTTYEPGMADLVAHGDDTIRTQDDLFGQVNGSWFDTAEIPADLPMVGGFIDLTLQAEAEVGEVLREASVDDDPSSAPPGSDRRKVGDLFASFMDEAMIETLGTAPLDDDLAAIEAVEDVDGLVFLIGRLQRQGLGGLVRWYVNADDRRSDRYVVNLIQGGLGLPDEAYYRDEAFAEVRAAYLDHIAAMFRLLGWAETDANLGADRVVALETKLAAAHWDKVRCRDRLEAYNLLSRTELEQLAPRIDWVAWFEELSGGSAPDIDEVIVRQPSFVGAASELLAAEPLDDWKAWLTFHLLSSAAPYLPAAFVDANFSFFGRTLTGAQENRERWKRGVDLCGELIGEAVGREFVARVFPPEAKSQMEELVANLIEAYRVSIAKLDWMTADTRDRALAKLEMFRPKIGYPDDWRDYSALEVDRTDLVGNVHRANAFETDRNLAKLGTPVDRSEWLLTPQTVNAYYNPATNEICFPAAILRPPYFRLGADPALNYGGIGAVIGHEIGHGFDDQGSQYDGDGNMVNWWTDEDRASFRALADKLIAQYDGFEPRTMPGHRVNGALTVGENIGDLGGLTIALLAYQISLADRPAPVIDGMSGLERLFRNWAAIWRIKVRPELALQYLSVDPHSPAEFRANIVRNLDEFHVAFETNPDDGLWLDPEDRVRIW